MRIPRPVYSICSLAEPCSPKTVATPGTLWGDILFLSQGVGKAVSLSES